MIWNPATVLGLPNDDVWPRTHTNYFTSTIEPKAISDFEIFLSSVMMHSKTQVSMDIKCVWRIHVLTLKTNKFSVNIQVTQREGTAFPVFFLTPSITRAQHIRFL